MSSIRSALLNNRTERIYRVAFRKKVYRSIDELAGSAAAHCRRQLLARRYRGLACGRVAVRRRVVLVMRKGQGHNQASPLAPRKPT